MSNDVQEQPRRILAGSEKAKAVVEGVYILSA
jgi:hypothetical protein